MDFCKLGIQYFGAGRSAALQQQFPVPGNLFHHAIEMLLKGMLCTTVSKEDLKYAIGHDLGKAWSAFKQAFPDKRLDAFDLVIQELDKFEDLRYPEEEGLQGANILKRAYKAHTRFDSSDPQTPTYLICVEDIDELVKLIFEITNQVNPKGLVPVYQRARDVLLEENDHPFF